MPGKKKVFVKTYGCQMNVYDSERIIEAMAPVGFEETDVVADADVIVLNTCHIREKAAEKVYSELGRMKQIKADRREAGKSTTIAVAGCVAQAEGVEMIKRAPTVDVVVGPQSYQNLPELVFQAEMESRQIVNIDFPEQDKFGKLPHRQGPRQATAFLTVQEGCDKFCTFCVVPYTRGMEFSRPVSRIIEEAEALTGRGVRELTLLGQNVNAYHGDGPDGLTWSLSQLINRLSDIDNLDRIRYTTSHPRDMSDDLIEAHRVNTKLMPYLHLPFQAGADRILAAMNRKHTADDYLRLVDRIRTARPDIALSTDIIVGFPGETDAEFERTLSVVETVGFAQAYSFKYSPRPGTPAANIDEQLDEALKTERLHRLQALLEGQQNAFNASCVGRTFPVLFEKSGRNHGQLVGRSPYLQPVHADAPDGLVGTIRPVEISAATKNSLSGVVLAA
ncbi:MAG TPA: tRNA (N6-isopentenyl adenosine(37)-C2)-methylthiotransferase MiaB [Hyphomicrobiaceae bacterium]|nr:tRNA (N6-isopentenyl adenosine(37)-C2)-methylthiotransferase MiaB [Hyphomicrobiaceae bacterium]